MFIILSKERVRSKIKKTTGIFNSCLIQLLRVEDLGFVYQIFDIPKINFRTFKFLSLSEI